MAFPGYIADVDDGDTIFATTIDGIRDRALQIFDTTTNRDAAITAPQIGQSGVVQSGTNFGHYIYSGATDKWRPPWNMPWGFVANVGLTALAQAVTSTTAVDVTGATVTFTAVANRLYRVSSMVPLVVQSGTTGTTKVGIYDGSNNALTQLIDQAVPITGAVRVNGCGFYIASGIAAGSFTFKLRALTSAGTATISGATSDPGPVTIVVEDIGPNGAPS